MIRRLLGEWLGTFSLMATVVGSGIMAERLADGNLAIALLGNTISVGKLTLSGGGQNFVSSPRRDNSNLT